MKLPIVCRVNHQDADRKISLALYNGETYTVILITLKYYNRPTREIFRANGPRSLTRRTLKTYIETLACPFKGQILDTLDALE